jgi:MFS family permease
MIRQVISGFIQTMSSTPSASVVLAATLTVQSLVAMALLTLPVVAPSVAESLGISAAYVGLYIALAYAGAMTASLLAGGAVRRFGAIRSSQIGLLLCGAGVAICTIESPVAMAIGAVMVGMGYGPITPSSSHLLVKSTPAHRMSLVFSIKQTGVPLGGVLAGVIVPTLAEMTSWQWAFLAVAAANVVCAFAIQPLCATLDADKDRKQRISFGNGLAGPLRLVFSQRSLTVLAAVSFLFSISQLSLTTYLVTFLHEDLGMGLIVAGFILAVAQTAGVAGRLLWGYVADRFLGPSNMLAVLAILIAVCGIATALLQYTDSMLLLIVVLSVFGSSAVGWNGVYLAEVARQAPKGQASVATGGTLAMTFLGVVIGPPLFGLVAGTFGSYSLAYATLILPAGLCLWLLLRYRSAFIR